MSGEQLANLVFLTQTDTTVGFVSQNSRRLTQVKQRPPHKYYIKALSSLQKLKSLTRVPEKYKNRVRKAQRTTFIFPNGHSYRIIRDPYHQKLIKKYAWMYTTSANISGNEYDDIFAREAADVIVGFPARLKQKRVSSIFKLNNINIKRIR